MRGYVRGGSKRETVDGRRERRQRSAQEDYR
jgi:hypothetical protein